MKGSSITCEKNVSKYFWPCSVIKWKNPRSYRLDGAAQSLPSVLGSSDTELININKSITYEAWTHYILCLVGKWNPHDKPVYDTDPYVQHVHTNLHSFSSGKSTAATHCPLGVSMHLTANIFSSPDWEGLAGLRGAVRGGVAGTSAQVFRWLVRVLAFVCGRRAIVQGVCVIPAGHSRVRRVRVCSRVNVTSGGIHEIVWYSDGKVTVWKKVRRKIVLGMCNNSYFRLIPTWQRYGQRTDSPQEHLSLGFPRLGTPEPSCKEKRSFNSVALL